MSRSAMSQLRHEIATQIAMSRRGRRAVGSSGLPGDSLRWSKAVREMRSTLSSFPESGFHTSRLQAIGGFLPSHGRDGAFGANPLHRHGPRVARSLLWRMSRSPRGARGADHCRTPRRARARVGLGILGRGDTRGQRIVAGPGLPGPLRRTQGHPSNDGFQRHPHELAVTSYPAKASSDGSELLVYPSANHHASNIRWESRQRLNSWPSLFERGAIASGSLRDTILELRLAGLLRTPVTGYSLT